MTEPKQVPGRGSPSATPRWVKIFVIVFILVVLLLIALHLMGFSFGSHDVNAAKLFVSIGVRQLRA